MEPLTPETLRAIARAAGFEWTDAELEALRPNLERALELLGRLETLPLSSVEPTLQYRVI